MKKITNVKLQEQLDAEKYQRGFITHCDPSGMMDWCKVCQHSNGHCCDVTHDERRTRCLCAKAYRKMDKMNKEIEKEQQVWENEQDTYQQKSKK